MLIKREFSDLYIPIATRYQHFLWCRTGEFDKLRDRSGQSRTRIVDCMSIA